MGAHGSVLLRFPGEPSYRPCHHQARLFQAQSEFNLALVTTGSLHQFWTKSLVGTRSLGRKRPLREIGTLKDDPLVGSMDVAPDGDGVIEPDCTIQVVGLAFWGGD